MQSPRELFKQSLAWLRQRYPVFRFYTERDLVWTVQLHLLEQIDDQRLPYDIFNDYPLQPGSHRSPSADLAILGADGSVELAVAFKYEPSHKRSDILPAKLPMVAWGKEGVAKDVQRVQEFVDAGYARKACAIFIDEGGLYHRRTPYPGSRWIRWEHGIWALRAEAG